MTQREKELTEALRRLLAFPLALEPQCGESEEEFEQAIGHATDVAFDRPVGRYPNFEKMLGHE
jgi:hypothetical protein